MATDIAGSESEMRRQRKVRIPWIHVCVQVVAIGFDQQRSGRLWPNNEEVKTLLLARRLLLGLARSGNFDLFRFQLLVVVSLTLG